MKHLLYSNLASPNYNPPKYYFISELILFFHSYYYSGSHNSLILNNINENAIQKICRETTKYNKTFFEHLSNSPLRI